MKQWGIILVCLLLIILLAVQGVAMSKAEIETARKNGASFKVLENLQVKMKGSTRLNERFAGASLDNNGNLVINVTEEDPAFRIAGTTLRVVPHSLTKLQSTLEVLDKVMMERKAGPISLMAISEQDNKVVVYVKDKSLETMAWLESLVDVATLDIRIGEIVKFEYDTAPITMQQTPLDETAEDSVTSSRLRKKR